jgi:predicted aldo/keto reductase-like oxidoreductase
MPFRPKIEAAFGEFSEDLNRISFREVTIMSNEDKGNGLTRRAFIKSVGLGGLAATGLDAARAMAGQEQGEGKASSVPKRRLGKTGVDVSILCLGGMFDTLNNQLLLRQAYNWGVTFWDTAEGYGNGMSEEGFGRFFTRNPEARKEIFLVTKTRPGEPAKMTGSLDASLKKLQTDNVDLFFCHAIGALSDIGEPIKEWASQMKKAGKIRFFGFSTHTNMEDCLLAAAKVDWVDAVMFTYNFRLMHTTKMKEAVEACVKAGIGLVAMKTQGGGPVKAESEAELQLVGKLLDRGFTDKQAKLKAVWEEPNIASICSQMPSLTILSANVAAARDLKALARSDLEMLDRYAMETCAGYCAGCGHICQAAVGGAVPVSDVMRSLMYYREYGDQDLARKVFTSLPDIARSQLTQVDYAEAEKACPQKLAISRLMEEASQLLA